MSYQRQAIRPERLGTQTEPPAVPPRTTLRGVIVDGSDGEAIHRLAALTGSTPPQGAVLLAERDGEPVAAVGIMDRHAVGDPRYSTFALRMRLQLERLNLRLVIAMRGF